MIYDSLPIYKSAMQLCIYVETIVKGFEKYHKYAIGSEMRACSREILYQIQRSTTSDKCERLYNLKCLKNKSEEMKMILYLAKELKAFKSFAQFEHSSKICVDICRQAQAWQNKNAGVT